MSSQSPFDFEEQVPPEIWLGLDFTFIHAAMLFVDIESSVLLSSALHPNDYQRLINEFQTAMVNMVWRFQEQSMFVAEYHVAGDQLSIFFYDPKEVLRNWKLDGEGGISGVERQALKTETARVNRELAYSCLKAAIQVKSDWLAQNSNLQRVQSKREALGLGIGMHIGRVHLCQRADGERRIEGYAVNFAKRVESFARNGKYSRIMLSQEAHDTVRGMVVKHTMLRQRYFFHRHEASIELLKGVLQPALVYELKFYSRVGIHLPQDVVHQYEQLFALDRKNIWAYYQLFEHYAYVEKNWAKVYELAKQAYLTHPRDEKIMLDFSRYYHHEGITNQALRFAEMALATNADFDLAYEHLAVLANERGDTAAMVEYLSRALSLTPGSPNNHLNLGFALCEAGELDEGGHHILEAIRIFPGYLTEVPATMKNMLDLRDRGKLPQAVVEQLELTEAAS